MARAVAKTNIGDPASNIMMGLLFIFFGSLISVERFQAYFVVGGIIVVISAIYSMVKGGKGISVRDINLNNIRFFSALFAGIFLIVGIIVWFISQILILIMDNVSTPADSINDWSYGLAQNAIPFTYEMMKFGLISAGVALLSHFIINKRKAN